MPGPIWECYNSKKGRYETVEGYSDETGRCFYLIDGVLENPEDREAFENAKKQTREREAEKERAWQEMITRTKEKLVKEGILNLK